MLKKMFFAKFLFTISILLASLYDSSAQEQVDNIPPASCDNLILNGNFENTTSSNCGIVDAGCSLANWNRLYGSPDLFVKGCDDQNYYPVTPGAFNLSSTSPRGNTSSISSIPGISNSNAIVGLHCESLDGRHEAIAQHLSQPLKKGHFYTMSFFALSANDASSEFYPTPNAARVIISVGDVIPSAATSVSAAGSLDPSNPSNPNIVNTINGDVRIDYNTAWTKYTITFQVPSNLSVSADFIYFGVCPANGNTENTFNYFDEITLYEQFGSVTGGDKVCVNSTLQLNSTFGGVWASSNPLVANVNNTSGLVTGLGTGFTYITCTDGTNCKNFSTLVQVVPTISLSSIQGINTLCAGTTYSALTCSPAGGVWSTSDASVIDVVSTTGEITSVGGGIGATITYTYSNPVCSASISKYIPIKAESLIPNHNICVGSTETAIGTLLPGQSWYSTNTDVAVIDPYTGLIEAIGIGNTNIGITGFVDGSNCPREIQFKLSALESPVINGNAVLCSNLSNQSTTLTSSIGNVVWYYNGNSLGITTTSYTTNKLGEYQVLASNGCLSPLAAIISGDPITPQITGNASACMGRKYQYSGYPTLGGSWVATRGSINSNGEYTPASAGAATIKYTVTSRAGCTKSTTINITNFPQPAIPSIAFEPGTSGITGAGGYCTNRTFTLIGTPASGVWTKTGVISISPSGTPSTKTVVSTGAIPGATSVTYTFTDNNGCSNSKTMSSAIVACSPRGVKGQSAVGDEKLVIYPNPAHKVANLNIKTLVGNASVVITDLYGKQLKVQSLNLGTNIIDLGHFAKGVYIAMVITETGSVSEKLIVE